MNPIIITKKDHIKAERPHADLQQRTTSTTASSSSTAATKKPSIRDFFPSWTPYEGMRRSTKQTQRFSFEGNHTMKRNPYSNYEIYSDIESPSTPKKRGRPPKSSPSPKRQRRSTKGAGNSKKKKNV